MADKAMFFKVGDNYYCRATGEVCQKITKHFADWTNVVRTRAENRANITFHQPCNQDICPSIIKCYLYSYIQNIKKHHTK